jgi:hypothetical protein
VVTENNPHLEQHLSDFYVFTGFVPPGKHTVIIRQKSNYYFKNILVDGCKHDVLPVVLDTVPVQKPANILSDWQSDASKDFEFQFQSLVNSW